MATALGVRDSINRQIIELKWEIQAKKEAASAADCAFLDWVTNQEEMDADKLFNPFFQLAGKSHFYY
jgi:predicted membrane-bound dolichyl-phosphate-mannose-protein mannosyltransferase